MIALLQLSAEVLVITLLDNTLEAVTAPALMQLLDETLSTQAFARTRAWSLHAPRRRSLLANGRVITAGGAVTQAAASAETILLKDAVYSALTLCGYQMFEHFTNVDNFIVTRLLPEAMDPTLPPLLCVSRRCAFACSPALAHPARSPCRPTRTRAMVPRRRLCLFVHVWCSLKLSMDLRPTLYEAFVRLLDRSETTLVRLCATKALHTSTPICPFSAVPLKHGALLTLRRCGDMCPTVVEDFEFDQQQFLPYISPAFSGMCALLYGVQEAESLTSIVTTLSSIISYAGPMVRSLARQPLGPTYAHS